MYLQVHFLTPRSYRVLQMVGFFIAKIFIMPQSYSQLLAYNLITLSICTTFCRLIIYVTHAADCILNAAQHNVF